MQGGFDKRLRVIAMALLPGLRLARIAGLGLDDLIELVTLAYFEEHQRSGLSWTALERRLGRSRRTIASLSKRVTESGFAIDGSATLALQRQVIELLAKGPIAQTEIAELCAKAELDTDAVLAPLIDAAFIDIEGENIVLRTELLQQLGVSFEERLNGLRHFMDTVAQVAHQRFFSRPGDASTARTVGFSVDSGRRITLGKELFEEILARISEADSQSEDAQESAKTSLIFALVDEPKGPAWKT